MNQPQNQPDESLVAAYFRELGTDAAEPSLPNPGTIWWKAQLRARRAAMERAARPIRLVERLSWGCAAGVLAAAVWQMLQIVVLFQQSVWLLAAVLATVLISAAATLYLVRSRP
jgi:hypothetical protein